MGIILQPTHSQKYLNHPLFSQITLDDSLKNNYHCVTIEVSYTLSNPTSVNRWLNALNCHFDGISTIEKDNFQHFVFDKGYQHQEDHFDSLLLPIKYSWKRQGLIGKDGVLRIHFQALNFTLEEEIQGKVISGQSFKETELWFLLYKLVELQYYFEEKHKKIGNVHPQHILINSSFQFKVFSKYSTIDGKDNFELKSHDFKAKAFLAPEEINDINNKDKLHLNQNENISEIFSIGLTVLCAATLSVGDEFYVIHEKSKALEMKIDKIQEQLKSLEQHFSSFLYNVITKILQTNPDKRISAKNVYLSLKQYQSDILAMRSFLPNLKKPQLRSPEQKSFGKTQTQFEQHIEEYKRGKEFHELQQRRLHQFYRKFKF